MSRSKTENQPKEGQGRPKPQIRPLFVRVGAEASAVTGMSNATRWRMESEGKFPKRRKIGGCSGYLYSELEQYYQGEV